MHLISNHIAQMLIFDNNARQMNHMLSSHSETEMGLYSFIHFERGGDAENMQWRCFIGHILLKSSRLIFAATWYGQAEQP